MASVSRWHLNRALEESGSEPCGIRTRGQHGGPQVEDCLRQLCSWSGVGGGFVGDEVREVREVTRPYRRLYRLGHSLRGQWGSIYDSSGDEGTLVCPIFSIIVPVPLRMYVVILHIVLHWSNSPSGQAAASCGLWFLIVSSFPVAFVSCWSPRVLSHESIPTEGLCFYYCRVPRDLCCPGLAFVLFSYLRVSIPLHTIKF